MPHTSNSVLAPIQPFICYGVSRLKTFTKLKYLLPFIFALVLGMGIGSTIKDAQNQETIGYIMKALEAERAMSIGSLYEIMAWESFHLRQKGLSPEDYACRFTDAFNPAHSANPSTPQNIEAMRDYSKTLKDHIGNEPQCYTFEALAKQELSLNENTAN